MHLRIEMERGISRQCSQKLETFPSTATIRVSSTVNEMKNRVTELTNGQGGVDWHVMRSTSGAITSTTAPIIFRYC